MLLSVLANTLKEYQTVYEIIDHQSGVNLLNTSSNIIFKYQYLWANKSLEGADKYIIADRKDLDAWTYSSYMSFVNHKHHGKLEDKEYFYEEKVYQAHKKNLLKMYNESWIPERQRLLKQGADIVWYEDIKDNFKNVYWNNIKLEKVWSKYAYKR